MTRLMVLAMLALVLAPAGWTGAVAAPAAEAPPCAGHDHAVPAAPAPAGGQHHPTDPGPACCLLAACPMLQALPPATLAAPAPRCMAAPAEAPGLGLPPGIDRMPALRPPRRIA